MTELGRTLSGRTRVGRSDSLRSYCLGCEARITKGEPKASAGWPAALSLTATQRDLLLQAAAEYSEVCDEAGEYESAVEFVDWCSIDALRDGSSHVEADGAPARLEGGTVADHRSRLAHRHPFVLPQAGRGVR